MQQFVLQPAQFFVFFSPVFREDIQKQKNSACADFPSVQALFFPIIWFYSAGSST